MDGAAHLHQVRSLLVEAADADESGDRPATALLRRRPNRRRGRDGLCRAAAAANAAQAAHRQRAARGVGVLCNRKCIDYSGGNLRLNASMWTTYLGKGGHMSRERCLFFFGGRPQVAPSGNSVCSLLSVGERVSPLACRVGPDAPLIVSCPPLCPGCSQFYKLYVSFHVSQPCLCLAFSIFPPH